MYNTASTVTLPPIALPDGRTIKAPHPEWSSHWARWRWLLDSYEGGDAYRFAVYPAPQSPFVFLDVQATHGGIRNLVPHKTEWLEGIEAAHCQTSPDYAIRLLRTPVPSVFPDAIDKHLGAIFNEDIRRKGPKILDDWWLDVDGRGSSMDHWMSSRIAPMLLALGVVDGVFDRPPAPKGSKVESKADERKYKLDRCVASFALPENVVWWTLDWTGEYVEVLIREPGEDPNSCTYVYWNADEWVRYDDRGKQLDGPRGGGGNPYGVVPVFRGMDEPMRPRCQNVAIPRYEGVAEIQREIYNRESELVLNDASQAHPLATGPEQYCQAGAKIPTGPNNLLPKPLVTKGMATVEQDWGYVDPPKGAPESVRANLANLRDQADRATCQTKPAGAAGSDGTVSQSGISKRLDQSDALDLLGEIAKVLQRWEERAARMAYRVLTNGQEPPEGSIKIEYPTEFDLDSLPEFLDGAERFEALLAMVGSAPATEGRILQKAARMLLRGLTDDAYAEIDAEIDEHLKARKDAIEQGESLAASLSVDAAQGAPISSTVKIGDPTTQPVGQTTKPVGQTTPNPNASNLR